MISSHCSHFCSCNYPELVWHILSYVWQSFLDGKRNSFPPPNSFNLCIMNITVPFIIPHVIYFLDHHEMDYLSLDLNLFANIILKNPGNICIFISKEVSSGNSQMASGADVIGQRGPPPPIRHLLKCMILNLSPSIPLEAVLKMIFLTWASKLKGDDPRRREKDISVLPSLIHWHFLIHVQQILSYKI